MAYTQQTLLAEHDRLASVEASVKESDHEYGAVFTRRWVVDLILDLVGYTPDRDLAAMRAIEPACGLGAFVGPMVERLVASCRAHGRDVTDAAAAIHACDLQPANVHKTRRLAERKLIAEGLNARVAAEITGGWVVHDDFLLAARQEQTADYVVGNPPYIRLEAVPAARNDAYRRACPTMGGRADVYVGFFEVGLRALRKGGALGFICADRWMRNQYGGRLREMVASHFAVETVIEMHDVDAFDEEVSAYPSITVVRRASQGPAIVATGYAGFGEADAEVFSAWASKPGDRELHASTVDAARLPTWFGGQTSWPSASPERLALLAALESALPALEDEHTGTRVGIGVATGADGVFVAKDSTLVEQDRLLPLAMARDTHTGTLRWSGHYLVDPWDRDAGGLVSLAEYPRLRAYMEAHAGDLRRRNVAGRQPDRWYRTIDRVDHTLTAKPKLLIPDIKAEIHPVLDKGGIYPHHNLYWVTSSGWDIRVLGGLLLSSVAQMFVECYAVRMRGGYLRFQAQYLRRIRVPRLESVDEAVARDLATAFDARDAERATVAALRAYGIDELPP